MKVKGTQVRLPIGVPERIDMIMGPNKRAEFIRDAVERELERREGGKTSLPEKKEGHAS